MNEGIYIHHIICIHIYLFSHSFVIRCIIIIVFMVNKVNRSNN